MELNPDLAAAIDAEYTAMFGEEQAPAAPEPEPEPVKLPEQVAHSAWPDTWTFSEAFDAEDYIKDSGKRDLLLPKYAPDFWPEAARAMIPGLIPYYVHNLDMMYNLAVAIIGSDTTFARGHTGTGKTSGIYMFAAVMNMPVWITSCYEEMETTELVGSTGLVADPKTGANITQYNPSQLVHSLDLGGICLLDEADRCPCLMAIQPLLEDKNVLVLADADGLDESERVKVAPDGNWFIFLSGNSTGTGDDSGAYRSVVQDLSSLDRITMAFEWPYNPAPVERDILARAFPALPEHMAKDMVATANLIREAFIRGAMLQTASMRMLLSWARKWATTGDLKYGYIHAMHGKLDTESASISAEIWHQVMGEEL
jgi:cobaltochelatase CobS